MSMHMHMDMDMDNMNMSTTTMDHGSHGMPGMSGMSHMMNMYFTTEWKMTYVLFKELMLMKTWHLAVACVVLAIIAALYEGLKVLREYLLYRYGNQVQTAYIASNGYGSKDESDNSSDGVNTVSARMCTGLHFLQTFLHIIQVAVSYLLMLVVMTFNVWLCLSVVLGAGLGYFLFGWKRAVIVDSNEHCH